jgi:hypothetical protein
MIVNNVEFFHSLPLAAIAANSFNQADAHPPHITKAANFARGHCKNADTFNSATLVSFVAAHTRPTCVRRTRKRTHKKSFNEHLFPTCRRTAATSANSKQLRNAGGRIRASA